MYLDKRNKTVYLFKHGKKEYLLMKQNVRGMVSKLPVSIHEQFGSGVGNDGAVMNVDGTASPTHSQANSQGTIHSMKVQPQNTNQQKINMAEVDEMLLHLEREEQLEQIILLNQFLKLMLKL